MNSIKRQKDWKWSKERWQEYLDILGISELNGPEWVNVIQRTVISTTVGNNPLEEREEPL